MARVNCYLPDDLKAAVEAIHPPVSFSAILRAGAVATLRERRGATAPEPDGEPV